MNKFMRRNHTSAISLKILTIFIIICVSSLSFANDASWKKEYNRLCGNTQEGMLLPEKELMTQIEECDKLLTTINATDNPKKKLYIFRLKKCRNFYQYIIDSKESGGLE